MTNQALPQRIFLIIAFLATVNFVDAQIINFLIHDRDTEIDVRVQKVGQEDTIATKAMVQLSWESPMIILGKSFYKNTTLIENGKKRNFRTKKIDYLEFTSYDSKYRYKKRIRRFVSDRSLGFKKPQGRLYEEIIVGDLCYYQSYNPSPNSYLNEVTYCVIFKHGDVDNYISPANTTLAWKKTRKGLVELIGKRTDLIPLIDNMKTEKDLIKIIDLYNNQ